VQSAESFVDLGNGKYLDNCKVESTKNIKTKQDEIAEEEFE